MALLTSELRRIRDELGYNVLQAGAEPYIQTQAVFDQVIALYMQAGAASTSMTVVTAATSPTLVSLTLASATGFTAGDNVAVDVDSRYEQARIESVSGSTIALLLSLAHSGTYAVSVEGGEMIVREKLREIARVREAISTAVDVAGLKRADEVEWYPGRSGGGAQLQGLQSLLSFWRDELASTLGVVNLRSARTMGSTMPVLY